MNEQNNQALQVIEQLRLRSTLTGADHDAVRGAVQTFAQALQQLETLKVTNAELTAKLAAGTTATKAK